MPTILHSDDSGKIERSTMRAPSLFRTLPEDIQRQLREGAVRRTFTDGQVLQQRGDTADGFWLIEKGQVKVGNYDADGDMHALFIVGAGSSFGELACLGEFPRIVAAEAIGTLETLWISDGPFFAAIEQSSAASKALIRALSAQLQEAASALIEMRSVPAPKRIARRLLALCSGEAGPVQIAIRQQELAELVGASRMTVGSTLTELEHAGLIKREYRHIVVHDSLALRAWIRR